MFSVRSAYIHIPFCRRHCYYCDFPVSIVGDKPPTGNNQRINGSNSGTIAHYVQVLCQEIRQSSTCGQSLVTVFFGGGTPSLLSVEQLNQILAILDHQFGIAAEAEISMEIDPATFDLEQVKGYKAAGVNRVSLGVQAFQPELLKLAGRSHTVEDIYTAVALVRQAGFTNISLDLISGLPYQTLEQWEESLERAIALSPTHLSCYDLILEAGTPFSRQYQPGNRPLPSDEMAAEMYRMAQQRLTTSGFDHYEISNYAKPGYQCQHNRTYWENRPFYGFGMGATSYLNGERFARPRKTWEYYEWVETQGKRQKGEGRKDRGEGRDIGEVGSQKQAGECESAPDVLDTVMLGLRLAEGLEIARLIELFGESAIVRLWKCLQPYLAQGLVAIAPAPQSDCILTSGKLKLTDPEGFLFSNVVLTAIFEEFE
ncbi:putative oxygen-independent coproporphyrinogen III oxidase [Leptolyngbyaceae cyanobacterium JSC-12]|nr:putative oxygen-independent coproporphyrinogen III oxidase [Leptolyngbyaceae cyanobacterium JSC-12]